MVRPPVTCEHAFISFDLSDFHRCQSYVKHVFLFSVNIITCTLFCLFGHAPYFVLLCVWYQIQESDEARKKFSNAKSISSSQFFGDQSKDADVDAKVTLSKFSVCVAFILVTCLNILVRTENTHFLLDWMTSFISHLFF